jgi:hypothetical protein
VEREAGEGLEAAGEELEAGKGLEEGEGLEAAGAGGG